MWDKATIERLEPPDQLMDVSTQQSAVGRVNDYLDEEFTGYS
jgi:hypothetical protein